MEKCANCERDIGNLETPMVWQESVVCEGCYGRLANKGSVASNASPAAISMPPSDEFECPACASSQVQRAKVLYEGGTSTGIGGALFGDDVGIVATSSQTNLARKWAPPSQPSFFVANVAAALGGMGVFIGVVVVICAVIDRMQPHNIGDTVVDPGVGILVALMGGFVLAMGIVGKRSEKEATAAHSASMSRWSKTWVCLRCGKGFIPDQDQTLPSGSPITTHQRQ